MAGPAPQLGAAARGIGRGLPTLPLLALAGFVSLVSMRLCDAMLPALAAAFSATTAQASSVITSFAIVYGTMMLVYGPLGDRFGKPRVIACATAWCALAALAASAAPTLGLLAVARGAMGAGAAAIVPLALAWIGDTVPMDQRHMALARYSGATLSGIMVGAWAGGAVTEALGWRAGFVMLAPLFLLVAITLWRNAGARPAAPASAPPPYWRQVRTLLAPPWARMVLSAVFVEGVCTFSTIAFLPSTLQARFGLSLSQGGAVLALFAVGGLLFSRSAGPLMRRLRPPAQARAGSALLGLGFGLLAWMPHWGFAIAGCAFGGYGFYMLHNTLQVSATQLSTTSRGLAVSLFGSCLFFGQSVGVPLAAQLFAHLAPGTVFGVAALVLTALGLAVAHQLDLRQQDSTGRV